MYVAFLANITILFSLCATYMKVFHVNVDHKFIMMNINIKLSLRHITWCLTQRV